MKKLIALLLSLVMLFALTIPAFADGPDGPPSEDWYAELMQKAINEAITAHGGVPGQINVMVNGTCVKFTDAVPEVTNGRTMVPFRAVTDALGGESSYDSDTKTVTCVMGDTTLTLVIGSEDMTVAKGGETTTKKMDCAPYVKGGRTYVPMRFISEALGYDVGWDNTYRTAIIADLDALAAKIDQEFTILNKYMAAQPAIESAQKSTGSTTATITLMDSLSGNQTKTLTAKYDGIISPDGLSMKMDYNFAPLWDLIEAFIPVPPVEGEPAEQYTQQLEMLKGMLSGTWEIRADMKNNVYYYAMPIMNTLLSQQGMDIADDAWISIDMGGLMKELEAQGVGTAPSVSTIGELFRYTLSANGVDDFNAYSAVLEVVDVMAKLAGDKKFTTSGSTHTLTLTKADLEALTEDTDLDGLTWDMLSKFSLTIKLNDNGDADVALDCTLAMTNGTTNLGDMVELSVKSTQKGGKAEMTAECHVKNMVKVTVKSTQTTTATNKAPEVTPPKGATVVDFSKLNGGTITSPDGP